MASLIDIVIPAAHAHEKWFVGADTAKYVAPEWYTTVNIRTIALVVALAAFAVVGERFDRGYERSALYGRIDHHFRSLRRLAPRFVALTLGVFFIWSAWHGVLMADNYPAPAGMLGASLLGIEFAAGALLVSGIFTAEAAIASVFLYGALFALFPWQEPLEYLYFPGIAAFVFAFAPDGPLGAGLRARRTLPLPQRKQAYLVMRIMTGIAFMYLALGKLHDPGLHFALMDAYPDFNPFTILHSIGIGIDRELYVFLIAAGELFTGVAVLLGLFQRVLGLLLIPLFMVSVLFLGPGELVGHIPIIGALFAFFAFGDTYRPPEKNGPDTKSAP